MKKSVLNLKEETTQHWFSYFQISRKYFYDWPVKYYFLRFWFRITRITRI